MPRRGDRARPRWRLFGVIRDWRPRPGTPGSISVAKVAASVAASVPCDSVAVGAAGKMEPGTVRVHPSRSHRLGSFESTPQPPRPQTPAPERSRAPIPPLRQGERIPDPMPDGLRARLSAILQPPLEALLAPNGILEWHNALLPHQIEGVRMLLDRRELLLADDMGLGKTIQVLAALRILYHRKAIARALVVVPASLTRQWRREASLWAPELKVVIVAAPAIQRAALWRLRAHITIVGYETLREDGASAKTTPSTEAPWDVVVLDEASKIKNRETGVSRAAKRLPRGRRWALTGTPLETSAEDVRSILEFLLGEADRPARVPTDVDAIKGLLRTHQLRRKKEDVLKDLPRKRVTTIELDLSPGQRRAYDEAESLGIVQLRAQGAKVTVSHVLELIVRLKQICNVDPASGESAKLEEIGERLETLVSEGHRALLFTQFTDDVFGVAMAVHRLAKHAPIAYTGAMNVGQKLAAEDLFRSDERRKLMILSLRAGGMGLNLQTASYVFHLDRWWNPAIEEQAESRAHRMGQQWPVNVNRYVCAGTIEERIEHILAVRRGLFAEVVDDVTLDLGVALTPGELFGMFGLEVPHRA